MLNKGDKVKAVKPYGIQTGDVFYVKQVCPDSIKLEDESGTTSATIPMTVYDSHFTNFRESWSVWGQIDFDALTGDCCSVCPMASYCSYGAGRFLTCSDLLKIEFRTNGKKVQVRKDGHKASSSCNKTDSFDLSDGLLIAVKRLGEKMIIADTINETDEYITRVLQK